MFSKKDSGPQSPRFGDFDDAVSETPPNNGSQGGGRLKFSSPTEKLLGRDGNTQSAEADFVAGPSGIKDKRALDDVTRSPLDRPKEKS